MRSVLLALCVAGLFASTAASAQWRYSVWVSRSADSIVDIPLPTPPRGELDQRDVAAFESLLSGILNGSSVPLNGVDLAEVTRTIDVQGMPHPIFAATSLDQIRARLQGCTPDGSIFVPSPPSSPNRYFLGAIEQCQDRASVVLIGLRDHQPDLLYFYSNGVPVLPMDFNGGIFDGMRAGEVRDHLFGWIPGFARSNPPPPHQITAINNYLDGLQNGRASASSVQIVSLMQPFATAADMNNAVSTCTREAPYAIAADEARVNLICVGLLRWILLLHFDGQRLSQARIERAGVPSVVTTPHR